METSFKKLLKDYGPYFEELRKRIFVLALAFIGLFAAGFFGAPFIIKRMIDLFALHNVSYIVSSPFQAFSLSVSIGLSVAFAFTFPVVLLQLYGFLRPALTRRERSALVRYSGLGALLFCFGFAYGFAIHYATLGVVTSFNQTLGLENYWDINTFFGQIFLTSILLGILFQFPLVVQCLIYFGIVSHRALAANRRIIFALAVVIVALLPPTDGLSLLVMAVPLLGLFEVVLFLNRPKRSVLHEARV